MERHSVELNILTSAEVIEILGISKQRLSQLKKTGKLSPIKKNLYFLKDVEERRNIQFDLREKYFRPNKKVEE